jgi:DnaJ-like protein
VDPFRLIAGRKIQEAMDEGAFENLSGRGQPLPLDDDPFEDPALRMAHRLLRNNGFAPAWIEEGKDIEAAIARLRADRARARITADEFRRVAAALNRRILDFNLRAPSVAVHKRALDPDEAIG